MKLSVCIPVYGVEAYIERCARSLFAQTLTDVEFIFVDDCTPDRSMDVIRRVLGEYPSAAPRVRFLRHDVNRGLAVARRTAMAAATGEWLGHCDSDDWVDPDYYGVLVQMAERAGADMAWSGLRREFPDGTFHDEPPTDFLSGRELTVANCPSATYNAAVNKIMRREIALRSDVECLAGVSLGEDLMYTAQVVPHCRTVVACPDVFYHYRQGGASITGAESGRRRVSDLCAVVELLSRKLSAPEFADAVDRLIRDVLLAAIRYRGLSATDYRMWRRRLRTSLLSDLRHGIGKRSALALAELSYPLASRIAGRILEFL